MNKTLYILCLFVWVNGESQYVKKVAPCEYVAYYIGSDNNLWYGTGTGSSPTKAPLPSGHTVQDAAGGFNFAYAIDESGNYWTNQSGSFVQISTDTTGSAFTSNTKTWAWRGTFITIKSDSSAWYGGEDTFNIYHSGVNINMRPTAIGSGKKWAKFAMGGPGRIVGLQSGGNVWEFTSSTGAVGSQKTTPAPAIDIAASHLDYAVCLIQTQPGSLYGWPYFWGTDWGAWSNVSHSYSQPTSVKTEWGLTQGLSAISANYNSIHAIDSTGHLLGCGFNVQGEVGNGQEFVNRYTYPTYGGYGWDFGDHENPTGVPPVQIGSSTSWKYLWDADGYFVFWSAYSDVNDTLYTNGRNKSQVLGNGFHNLDEETSPNALDILAPTVVHPIQVTYKQYHFTAPNLSVSGGNQSISTNSTTLTAAGHSALLINSSLSTDTLGYSWTTYAWTQTSGPSCIIANPSNKSTSVTGLSNGTYVFQLIATDTNQGMGQATVTVTVSGVNPYISIPVGSRIIVH